MTPDVLRFYLAAPWELQADARRLSFALERLDMVSVARWLLASDPESSSRWALRCLADVDHAHCVVALNPAEWARRGTGGRHVEAGYAIARSKPIVVLGSRSNLFHFLEDVTVVELPAPGTQPIADVAAAVRAQCRKVVTL